MMSSKLVPSNATAWGCNALCLLRARDADAEPCYLSRTLLHGSDTSAGDTLPMLRLASALANGLATLATLRGSSKVTIPVLNITKHHMHLLRIAWIISLQRAWHECRRR